MVITFSLILLAMYLRWVPRWLDLRAAEAAMAAAQSSAFPFHGIARVATGVALLSAVAWIALAVLIFLKRSRDLLGLLLAVSFLSLGVMLTDLPVLVYMAREDAWAPLPATVFFSRTLFRSATKRMWWRS